MLLTDTSTYLKIYFLAYKLTIYILLHYCLLTIYTLSILFSYIPVSSVSYMSFIIQLLCNAILVTYSGCNDMAWQSHLMRKAFHCSALHIVFLQYMSYSIFCIQIFSTLYIYEQLCNM